ncbi:MAG: glutamate 5-kinase [Gammaproteobacteria bacterium]|nr:glutamate 5-kinase [Gammaproteobacteria bacterium]
MSDRHRDTPRGRLGKPGCWVVKIGSALATNEGRGLNIEAINGWADQFVALRSAGINVAVVASGAVAEGIARLGWSRSRRSLHESQVAAAVGQMGLVRAYELAFQRHNLHAAQILLTHDDLANRERYLNARSTLLALMRLGVFPVVNENDTVATEEIRFGDNDTLAGLVCNLLDADLLLILTDQEGLFTADPRHNPQATLVHEGRAGDEVLDEMAGGSGIWGRGGMLTKLRAARLAARSGGATLIASGRDPAIIARIAAGEDVGTLLLPQHGTGKLAARKQWLAGTGKVRGQLHLDEGAARVIRQDGRSLLAVGVLRVNGKFERGALVGCVDPEGREIARGLCNYSSEDTEKILGLASTSIEQVLGYSHEPELVHRDNLVVLTSA